MLNEIKDKNVSEEIELDGKKVPIKVFREAQQKHGRRIVENKDKPGTYRTLQVLRG